MAKIVTTQQIQQQLTEDFARKYRRFASYVEAGRLWDSLMETVSDPVLLGHYQFCNDVMGIPPARVHLMVWGQRLGRLNREEKQALGAFWVFVFKETLGYTEQQSVSCVVGGLKTASRYSRMDESPKIC